MWNERVQKQSFNRVLKGRATVRPLFEAMRGLTPQRKRVVREMGFGNLIDFPIVEIPTKLAFYVVDILNTRKMMLECPMGDIVITPKTVKEVLGLPMGRRKLEREGQREYNDPFLEEWKDQFKNINKLTIKALSDLIIDTKNTDYMFRMNILTLIANTLGSCENSSCLKFTVLRNVFEGDDLTYLHYTKIDTFKVKRRVPAFKSWNTRLLKKREISELQNYYMGIAEILDDVGEKEENEEKEELYELIEESIESILIDKAEIEEKINENLIKFQNDERLIQLRDKMKVIFKEPNIPEYHSSSSTESDDDDDDNSQVGDDNEKSYGTQTDSVEEDHVQIVTETQQEERNNLQYNDEENDEKGVSQSEDELMRAECNEKKDEQETGTSKEADNIKEERKANKKATNQKINEEIDPFDDPTFGEYYLQNEHLFVPTQTSAEKKDQTDDINWDSFLENEEEIIRKGREFSAEIRKNAQQQERERKRKGKREKDQIGSSSQESPVFGIVNSLQGSQPTFDLGASPTYEKMNILIKKKKKMGLKSKYVNKTVDPAVELTEDEKLLGRSIFRTQEEEEEEVFNDDEGLILFRMNIQSLAPGLEIDTSVIDMENDVEKMQMEDIELAFFPIIAHGHYYLIVFNLKTGKSVIIDNSESDATYEGKYKDNVEFVNRNLTVTKKATNLQMKWKKKEEKIDHGLYMIMHMELYEGSTASQWKTGLLPENEKNHRMQMDNLRSRIAAKILLHEVNVHQKKMSDYAKKMNEAGKGGSNRQ
ncbi:peptidase C48, SUMO/sentrin/Ubl1 [Tanacetum coccineum]